MFARSPGRKGSAPKSVDGSPSASAGKGKPGSSLGWVKEVLGRSIVFEERRKQLHVVLVDRRRGPGSADGQSPLLQMRAELRTRLLVHDPATQTVRNLVHVHEALGHSTGWTGVEALPLPVLAKALAEAEMLQVQDPTPVMVMIIEQLGEIHVAASARAEHERAEKEALLKEWETPEVPETSEATHEEYEQIERSWIGTVPDGLGSTDRVDHPG
jgi:hypothetical protein